MTVYGRAPPCSALRFYANHLEPPARGGFDAGLEFREERCTVRTVNREGVVVTFMRDIISMSTDDLGVLRSQSRWLERLKNAHTIPRELHADRDYRFDPPDIDWS